METIIFGVKRRGRDCRPSQAEVPKVKALKAWLMSAFIIYEWYYSGVGYDNAHLHVD